jgi:hypothetical protein
MSNETTDLERAVKEMRPFVPAKDFALSKRFYADLGFRSRTLGDALVEMRLGAYSFLLQDYYVKPWADNFTMHMLVADLGLWWHHISALDLSSSMTSRARGHRNWNAGDCRLPTCSIHPACSGTLPKCRASREGPE